MKRVFTVLVITVLNLSCSNKNPVSYEYPPFSRDSEEWKAMSGIERTQSLQIPENVLAAMLTEELVLAYMYNTGLLTAYASLQEGLERHAENFNGLAELLRREDCFHAALEIYKNIEPKEYEGSVLDFIFLEILIAQEPLLKKLNPSEVQDLFSEVLKKYQSKVEDPAYGFYSLEATALPLGRIMRLKRNDYEIFETVMQTPNIEYYLNYATSQSNIVEILNNIIMAAVEFVNL